MMQTIIEQKARCVLSTTQIEQLVKYTARAEKRVRGVVEIRIIGEAEMKKINTMYRGIRKPTDVLSFAWDEVEEPSAVRKNYLGQLCVCPTYIEAQAKRFKVTPQEECARSIVHGLLHLSGHDHIVKTEAEKMFAKQETIIAQSIKRFHL